MKKTILVLLASFLLLVVPSVSFGQGTTQAIDAAVDVAVDKFEDVRLSVLNTTEQVQLLKDIIGVIDVLKQQPRYADEDMYAAVIDSLRRALVSLLDDAVITLADQLDETPTDNGIITSTNTTHGFSDTITTSQVINDLPLLIIGGDHSDSITNFRMTAAGEDILLKELTMIINGSADAYQALESIALYDDDGQFIAQKTVTSNEITFSSLDLLIPVGSFNIYPLVKTRAIGYGEAGIANAQFTLTLRIDDTKGMSSGQPVGVTNNYISSKLVVVTPVLTSLTMNEKTGTLFLTKTDVAEFSITAHAHNNTTQAAPGSDLDTILEQLQFRVSQGNIDTTTPPTFTLSRENPLNSSTNELIGSWDPLTEKLTFDLNSWANDNGIIDGTVAFTVTVTNITELNPSNDTNILLVLEAGNDQAVIFGTNDAGYGLYSLPLIENYESGWKTKDN